MTPRSRDPEPKGDVRRRVRRQRRDLAAEERHAAAEAVARRVSAMRVFTAAQHLAVYLAFDGELDPAPLCRHAFAMGKAVYLPVLVGTPQAHMVFAPYLPDTPLERNRMGIPEPRVAREALLAPQLLDLVLAPMVAFDERGTRLGMGGGYYDRTFAFRRNPGHIPKPRLLGLAYELQRQPALQRCEWDVPLDGVATEEALYHGDAGGLIE